MRVWLYRSRNTAWDIPHFNSHTREGVTFGSIGYFVRKVISTHTPVRVWLFLKFITVKIFQFQLTHPWGCDFFFWCKFLPAYISTHTPVRVWLITINSQMIIKLFQLTHPWGCDRTYPLSRCGLRNFNSHTREGVTSSLYTSNRAVSVFQLTHPWGCDPIAGCFTIVRVYISTHTPVRVWPAFNVFSPQIREISTHTPVRVWPGSQSDSSRKLVLISTHTPVRVWPICWCSKCKIPKISTHTPVRVWPLEDEFDEIGVTDFNSHTREGVTTSLPSL